MKKLIAILSVCFTGQLFGLSDDTWDSTMQHAAELQQSVNDEICISIALLESGKIKRQIMGDCKTDSVFQIGSITKTFTGLLLADAVLRDEVSLPTTLASQIDQPVPATQLKPITLLNLATHSSGLPRLPNNINMDAEHMADPYLHYGETELLAFLANYKMTREPDEETEYSNLGMGLLGYLLSRKAELSYEELVGQRITAPLEMKDTFITPTENQRQRILPGHGINGNVVLNWQFDVLAGAGAIYSTVDDMLTYLNAAMTMPAGVLGTQFTLATQFHSAAPALGGEIGLAWIRGDLHGELMIWHNGGTAGQRSFIGFLPGTNKGVILLANADLGSQVDAMGVHLLDGTGPLPEIVKIVENPAGAVAAYQGDYDLSPDFSIQISTDGEKLFGQGTGQPRFTLRKTAQDRYVIVGVPAGIEFSRDDSGEVIKLILHQNGISQKALKRGAKVSRKVVQVRPDVLQSYSGTYELAPGFKLEITVTDNQLLVQATGQSQLPVFPSSQTRFYYDIVDAEIEFQIGPDGRVSGLVLHQNGEHPGRKL